MSIRRGWTVDQDRILKLLKEERKIKKWSSIAKIMDFQFNMCGRNGKQCRERYNNHLDDGIVQKRFSLEEQRILENLNDQIGNKWSIIAKAFKGRTANFLKNQLYSKLRKSIRKLNKFVKEMRIKQVKPFKLTIVYKIVQSNDFKIFQKQRHSQDDLKFYSQIKDKMLRFAEKHSGQGGNDFRDERDVMAEVRDIISKLIEFHKKYENLHKKMKKPRKRYFCEDDIILNSLSNNKLIISPSKLPSTLNLSNNSSSQSQQSDSQSQQSSFKQNKMQIPLQQKKEQATKLEIKQFESRHFQLQKEKDLLEVQKQTHQQKVLKQPKQQRDLQQSANQNYKIVEQAQIQQHNNNVSQLLEQSQQCHFIDIQYLDHFKSCSMIDQSLFQ